jgi:hypothetical protein
MDGDREKREGRAKALALLNSWLQLDGDDDEGKRGARDRKRKSRTNFDSEKLEKEREANRVRQRKRRIVPENREAENLRQREQKRKRKEDDPELVTRETAARREYRRDPDVNAKENATRREIRKRRQEAQYLQPETTSFQLAPVTEEIKLRVVEDAKRALGDTGMGELTCLVCDRLSLKSQVSILPLSRLPIPKMKACLTTDHQSYHPELWKQYDLSHVAPAFTGMPLSPRGVLPQAQDEEVGCVVCLQCLRAINHVKIPGDPRPCRVDSNPPLLDPSDFVDLDADDEDIQDPPDHSESSSSRPSPPKFAIANGFLIGSAPEFIATMTRMESMMVTQISPQVHITMMKGGVHKAIHSHCMLWASVPAPPYQLLPRSIESDFKVIIVGRLTTQQELEVRRRHVVRRDVIKNAFEFYKGSNVLYQHINEDPEWFSQTNDLFDRVVSRVEGRDTDTPSATGAAPIDRHQPYQDGPVPDSDESAVLQNTSVFIDTIGPDEETRLNHAARQAGTHLPTVSMKRSNVLVRDVDQHQLALTFPELFPFGRGDPDEPRPVRVSFEQCIRRYINLSTHQFSRHHSFQLCAFDTLSRIKGLTSISLRCRFSPDFAISASRVTSEELKAALRYRDEVMRAAKLQLPRPLPPPQYTDDVKALFSGIWAGKRSMWATNEERKEFRKRAYAYANYFGQHAIFFTLSPNAIGSSTVLYYAGAINAESIETIITESLPSNTRRREIISNDPIASAKYFDRLVTDVLITKVIGIDPKTSRSFAGGGVFGPAKAYLAGVETQGSGNLHIHGLVWLHSAPTTARKSLELLESPEGRRAIVEYASSVVRSNVPVSEIFGDRCPTCSGPLSILSISANASCRRWVAKQSGAPVAARCEECRRTFTSDELLREVAKKVAMRAQLDAVQWSDETVDALMYLPHPLRLPSPLHPETFEADGLILTVMLLRCQLHNWKHRESCWKKAAHVRNQYMCRFTFPRPLESCTMVADVTLELKYKRSVGNEYMNNYNDVFACVFRCNHDVRVVFGGDCAGVDLPGYISKSLNYVTKAQQTTENEAMMTEIAFLRRLDRESGEAEGGTNEESAGRKRMMALMNAQTSKQEIAAPLAALYLLRNSAEYTSHPVEKILLSQFLTILLRQHQQASPSTDSHPPNDATTVPPLQDEGVCDAIILPCNDGSGGYSICSQYKDYVLRSTGLADVNVYNFILLYQKVLLPKQRGDQESTEVGITDADRQQPNRFVFMDDHPQVMTHHVILRKRSNIVPDIVGPTLPDASSFQRGGRTTDVDEDYISDDELDDPEESGRASSARTPLENKELYSQMILILFKPFRQLGDLLGRHRLWYNAFEEWMSSGPVPPEAKRYMDFNADRYFAKRRSAEVRSIQRTAGPGDFSSASSDVGTRHGGPRRLYSDEIKSDSDQPSAGEEGHDKSYDATAAAASARNMYEILPDGFATDEDSVPAFPFAPIPVSIRPMFNMLTGRPRYMDTEAPPLGRTFSINSRVSKRDIQLDLKRVKESSAPAIDDVIATDAPMGVIDDAPESSSPPRDRLPTDQVVKPTEVELLDVAMVIPIYDEAAWIEERNAGTHFLGRSAPMIPQEASLGVVSKAYQLNRKQHFAFALIGRALLATIKYRIQSATSFVSDVVDPPPEQLLMYLGGEGGTGKSRVISAVQHLARSWSTPERTGLVRTCAAQGIAACLINGATIHSLFDIGRRTNRRDTSRLSERVQRMCDQLAVLIVDEVSMVSQDHLHTLDHRLRVATQVDKPFGGIHVVFGGDFAQLPPVGCPPVYIPPATSSEADGNSNPRRRNLLMGYNLWRMVKTVVILEENMRARADPEHARICSEIRLGRWTDEIINRLNTRYVGSFQQASAMPEFDSTLFVVHLNEQRIIFNAASVRREWDRCVGVKPTIYRLAARLEGINGREFQLDAAIKKTLYGLGEKAFDDNQPILDVYIGMRVMVTENICLPLKCANGSLAIVRGFQFHPSVQFRERTEVGNVVLTIPSHLPEIIFIELIDGSPDASNPLLPGQPGNIFPVLPITIGKHKFYLPGNRLIISKVTLFPLKCAAALTVHKVQGYTAKPRECVVLGSILQRDQPRMRAPPSASLYVMISRVGRLGQLYLLDRIPSLSDCSKYFSPRAELAAEMTRLRDLETLTLSLYFNCTAPSMAPLLPPPLVEPPPPPPSSSPPANQPPSPPASSSPPILRSIISTFPPVPPHAPYPHQRLVTAAEEAILLQYVPQHVDHPQEDKELFVDPGLETVKASDMFSTNTDKWFTNAIINRFIAAVVEYVKNEGHRHLFPSAVTSCYAFSSLFYTRLEISGYDGVQRWTRRVNIFSHSLLIIPINIDHHWTLVTVDLEDSRPVRLRYLDSLLMNNTPDKISKILAVRLDEN